jgi:ATP synthase protein I
MADSSSKGPKHVGAGGDLPETIGVKEKRKLRGRRFGDTSVWIGFSMMGVVGWAVALPTLLGAALGIWLDGRFHGKYSWTLMLLVTGLLLGCYNAWYWVAREGEKILREQWDDVNNDSN